MANSYVEYTGDGTQTDWTVPFPYLDESHVHLYFDGVEQTTGLSWPSAGVLRSAAAGSGVAVLVKRVTPDTALVNFENRNNLTADNLSTAGLQAIYRAVEAADRAAQSITINASGIYDFGGKRATNVGAPSVATDLVTKSYADTVINEAQTHADAAAASADSAASHDTSAAGHDASAATHEATAASNATLAQQWATKTDGEVVAGQGYGAKKYANDAAASASDAESYAASMANPWSLAGDWDASTGSFPATKAGGLSVDKGDVFVVSTEGTVDGHLFTAGDTLIAKVDTPSTTTYASNWIGIQGGVTAQEIENALGYTPLDEAAKATGSDIVTGTDDAKFVTSYALSLAGIGPFIKAWGVFNGSTSTTAAAMGMSFSRAGTGVYDVTFSTALVDANYVVVAFPNIGGRSINYYISNVATTGFRITVQQETGDSSNVMGSVESSRLSVLVIR